MSDSRPARAESLLYTVTCSVTGLLGYDCQPRQTPPSSPKETPSPGGSTSGNGSSDGNTSSSDEPSSEQVSPSGTPVASPSPIELEGTLREDLPAVAGVNTGQSRHTFPAHVAPIIQQQGGAVLGQVAPAPIEASEQGWKIMGVPWVWWVLVGMAIAAGAFAVSKYVAVLRRRQEA